MGIKKLGDEAADLNNKSIEVHADAVIGKAVKLVNERL
jgi:hypothetical protein